MKRAIRGFGLSFVFALMASNASAVDLASTATVTIVEGITITETAALNFGTLVLNNGSVVIATTGAVTDASSLTSDGTSQAPATFTVDSISGVDLDVNVVPDAAANGLTLGTMTFDYETDTANPVTSGGAGDVLTIGGTLTVDRTQAAVGANQTMGFTVSVTFD